MSFLDDLGGWVDGLFTGDGSGSLGDAASAGANAGADLGSGTSALDSGLSSGESINNLTDSLGTSPSIDSLLGRLGVSNGGIGETASSAYDGGGGDAIPGSVGSGSAPQTVAGVATSGAPQVTSGLAHQAANSALTANGSKSLLQRLMGAIGGNNVTPIDAAAMQQALGLIGALAYHKQPTSASQLQASLASPYNKFTPQQQATFNAWAYAPPKQFVPFTNGHARGGSVGGLGCLNYAAGGVVPGVMPAPQGGPMQPPMGMMGAPPPGDQPPQGPMTPGMPMQGQAGGAMPGGFGPGGRPGFGGGGLGVLGGMQNFQANHPNFMANHPGFGGGMATPGGGLGGGPLLGPNPGNPMPPGGGFASPGMRSFAMPTGGPMAPAAYADGGMVPGGGDPSQGAAFTGYVQGDDPGQSDLVPIRVSPGEYVFDADSVAALGDGNNAAGAALLDRLREKLREAKRSAPANDIPPPLASLAQPQQQPPQGAN